MGRFEKRRPEFEKKGATLAAVCVDPVPTSRALAAKLGLHYPILADPQAGTIRAWGVWHESKKIALPAIFIVGPDGRIVWRRVSETIGDRPSEDDVLAHLAEKG